MTNKLETLKELVSIANKLDRRDLFKEADKLDNIITNASFLREVPSSDKLEEYRKNQISFYEEEGRLNLDVSDDLSYYLDKMEFYRNATHQELLDEMFEEEDLARAFTLLRESGGFGQRREPNYFELALEGHAKRLIDVYGPEKLEGEIAETYGRSQFNKAFELSDERTIQIPSEMDVENLMEFMEYSDMELF